MKLYKYKQVAFKEDIPEKTSDLQNDSGYISQIKTINGNSLVGTGDITIGGGIGMVVCTQASDTPFGVSWKKPDASEIGYQVITGTLVASVDTKGKFYLVSDITASSPNVYNEYITVERLNEGSGLYQYFWEHVGITQVDLTNYYTKLETDTLLSGKQDTLTAGSGISITNNVISASGGGGGASIVGGYDLYILCGEEGTPTPIYVLGGDIYEGSNLLVRGFGLHKFTPMELTSCTCKNAIFCFIPNITGWSIITNNFIDSNGGAISTLTSNKIMFLKDNCNLWDVN